MIPLVRCVGVALVALLLAASQAAQWTAPAHAQGSNERIQLTLVSQPSWHDENDGLGLTLRISNHTDDPLQDYQVQLLAFDRIESRTALHDSFESPPETLIGTRTKPFLGANTTIAPGAERTVAVGAPLSSLGLDEDSPSGVYPLQVSLGRLLSDSSLDLFTTDLVFYPSTPQTPLNVVPVLALSAIPARDPTGAFALDPVTGTRPLEEALTRGGWLHALLSELVQHRGLRVGVAPTPRLVEEIADLADGFVRLGDEGKREIGAQDRVAEAARALLDDLRDLLERRGVQPLLVPYSAPDLPTTGNPSTGDGDLALRQWSEAQDVLSDALDLQLGALGKTWIFPPAGRLDAPTLEALQSRRAAPGGQLNTLFSSDSVEQPGDPAAAGCPEGVPTFACPVQVKTLEGTTTGFVADAGLQERFGALVREGDEALDLQRLFAETAMIREEAPSLAGRVVHFTIPSLWHPPRALARRLFTGLARAPWLRTLTPERALEESTVAVQRDVVDVASQLRNAPNGAYLEVVTSASADIESFATAEPSVELITRLRRDILVAQSRLWWTDLALVEEGESFAQVPREEVGRYLSNVQVGGRNAVTLTSREQAIPLVLFNDNPFDVRVQIHLRSIGLDFGEGPDFYDTLNVAPGNKPFTVEAAARASGNFSMEVELTTPDGALDMGEAGGENIRIRSTEFNRIALFLTLGALVYLVLFYTLRALRRRGGAAPDDASGPATA
ncbi:MAG: DUF6049 family protein [Actinomycetota bacterium]